MQKFIRFGSLFSLMLALCIWVASCSTPTKPIVLNVATAGLFRDVMVEVNQLYQATKPSIAVNYTIAGSDVLKRRIEHGESFDIYIASSSIPMDELEDKGLILSKTRQPFVSTQIALIVCADSQLAITDFKDLTNERVKTIAMSLDGPGVSTYTKEILTKLEILSPVKSKAILAKTDVREILKSVETKQVDIGITFLSEAQLSNKVRVVAVAPASLHRPVVSTLALLKNSQQITEAKNLVEFFKSREAMAVFQRYGFQAGNS